ncbi:hypothetical protein [Aurantiacibacter spongiae]|uniref:Energy transducer TonB n=1 Tax=Aurantiacibacter spongiae TaxID=2488860 RepID=A0A3N5DK22_9SPHN|nr:hypothetical protein [Aurantiacibacter spongiae]RPF71085.1 hypothetical protein EG799_05255 [Aurantiacibacter spongiae]
MAKPRYAPRRKLNWKTLALVALLHVLVAIGLVRTFAPDLTDRIVETATSFTSVTVATYEEPPPPPPEPEPSEQPARQPSVRDEGAAAEAGKQAVARAETAPDPAVVLPNPNPAPRASSTGTANNSGGADQGSGTGAGGEGEGTGSGNRGAGRGSGSGGGVAVGPSVKSGRIDAVRDFPIPEGGRASRAGTSVVVEFTVGVDGRAHDCNVTQPGPDPATNALVCPLVIERIRFNPARDRDGNPVPARYGWRQDFFRR